MENPVCSTVGVPEELDSDVGRHRAAWDMLGASWELLVSRGMLAILGIGFG